MQPLRGCHLRTPPERPSAFRRLRLLSSSPKSPDGYCYAIFALTVKLWLAVLCARRKNASAFSALLVVIPSLPRNLLERNNIKTRKRRSKVYPLPHGVSPVSVPLIAMQQGIHGKPKAFQEACADDSSRIGCAATVLRVTQKNKLTSSPRGDDGQARRTKRLRLSESNAGHSHAEVA